MATKTKMAKTEDELMQLTLQIRNRKDADKQYAKFHGDSLLGVSRRTDDNSDRANIEDRTKFGYKKASGPTSGTSTPFHGIGRRSET